MADKEQENIVEGKVNTGEQGSHLDADNSESASPPRKTGRKQKKIVIVIKNKKKNNKGQIALSVIQALASIATVFAAILALLTLNEMKTERDNTYRPGIVISPNIFEGGLEKEEDKEYIYINSSITEPYISNFDGPTDETRYVYLEKPYLTLKNIGQGIAKDVKVTFPTEWIDNALTTLNDNPSDDYSFMTETDSITDEVSVSIEYTPGDPETQFFLTNKYDTIKNLTYIAPGDDSVNVALPDNWCLMIAAFFNQAIRLHGPYDRLMGRSVDIKIPDLVVIIQFSDMQGNQHKPKRMVVPWTGHFTYTKTSALIDAEVESMHLWTGFFEDYIR